jgi:O-acetyl-ADP-ribose deacetylase (regulator of RNase III)
MNDASPQLVALQGDITALAVDAIVNAANRSLLGGGGVDGAIHRAAGPELLAECRTLGGCPTGEARITKGYRLPARWVIHTVGPIYGGRPEDARLLESCYRNCLALAEGKKLAAVAFPAISCGAYGYPPAEASRIAVATCRDALRHSPWPRQVIFVLFSETLLKYYIDLLRDRPSRITATVLSESRGRLDSS